MTPRPSSLPFSDLLEDSIRRKNSFLLAGYDPQLEVFPRFILEEANRRASDSAGIIQAALTAYFEFAIEKIEGHIAAVKPNIAFFEQYGLAGLKALKDVCLVARNAGLPVIIDAKRGDIGNTAAAYSRSFLGGYNINGVNISPDFEADAITVNPFLGLDSLHPFIDACREYGKGLFVLVRTSNPGAADFQDARVGDGLTVTERLADFLRDNADVLKGNCGLSGLGAVVGATNPEQARLLRGKMPDNFFLIPGFGAQGASSSDAVAGFNKGTGAIVNVSRGLFSSFSSLDLPQEEVARELSAKAGALSAELKNAVQHSK